MKTSDFDYDLPEARIAQAPLARGASRLLHLPTAGPPIHRTVADLPNLVRAGDLVVVNDTRVIPARIEARRATGGRVEILLVERLGAMKWDALLRPGKRVAPGETLELERGVRCEVDARRDDGKRTVRLSEPIEAHLDEIGHTPLPPYIRRADTREDLERYQTVYAQHPGAVAAPTAGLHFSTDLLEEVERSGARVARVTLHVGIGTFRPVQVEDADTHPMDSERCEVPEATAQAITETRAAGGRVLAVGTTVVRTLEGTVAQFGEVRAWSGRTDLFIRPGFPFRAVDRLLTNFHLPKSTLLMLVSAFAGRERVLAAYREAIDREYRFYSYGDAMLLERKA